MIFRKAIKSDLENIMKVIEDARARLKESGSLQWNTGDGYPSSSKILDDINNENMFIALDNDTIVGVEALVVGIDPNYIEINGKWLNNDKNYMAIHRIAVSNSHVKHGVGKFLIENAKKIALSRGLTSIKADTHKINTSMLGLLERSGFIYCGEITLLESEIDNKREAFEYLIK